MNRDCESGISLVEAVVALAILGLIAVVFLGGLITTSRVNFTSDGFGTAVSLAQLQTELVKSAAYVYDVSQYPVLPVPDNKDYFGYSVVVTVLPLHTPDDGIQKITVNISRYDKQVFRLESYKVDR